MSDSLNEMTIHSTFVLFSCFREKGHIAAIVVIIIFISLQGNVTITELWAISKLGVDDVDVVKGNHTAGTDVRENEIQYHFHGIVKNLKKLK